MTLWERVKTENQKPFLPPPILNMVTISCRLFIWLLNFFVWNIHIKGQKLNWETTKILNKGVLFSVLMYWANRARACSFWLPFLHNWQICFSNVKLLSTVTLRNFSLKLPSIEECLIFMDFKLIVYRNKWRLEEFTLKLLQQNQSRRFSIIVSRSHMTFENGAQITIWGGVIWIFWKIWSTIFYQKSDKIKIRSVQ